MTNRWLVATRLGCRTGWCVYVLATTIASSAAAQPTDGVQVFVDVSGGLHQPRADGLESLATITTIDPVFARDAVDDEFRTAYSLENRPMFDVGAGVLLTSGVSLGVAVSHHSDQQPGRITATLRHPAVHPTLTSSTTTDPLIHTETAVHLSVGYVVPVGRASVRLFAGPSRFSVSHDLLARLSVDEIGDFSGFPTTGPRFTLSEISSLDFDRVRGSAWGFHVGTDVSYFFTPHVGVGGTVRYGHATTRLQNPIGSWDITPYVPPFVRIRTLDVDAGGLDLLAGLRLRF